MSIRRHIVTLTAALAVLSVSAPALAQEKLKVLATFSILGDFVRSVGGDRVEVSTLVGPNSDAHVYSPAPADAKKVAAAKVVITNGLGFEGWMARLVRASGSKATPVVATKGIKPRKQAAHGHSHGHDDTDPHAWQSVANAKIYVANILAALIAADPAGKAAYEANAKAYLEKLDALDKEVREAVATIRRNAAGSSPRTMPSAISRLPTASNSSRRRVCRRNRKPRRATSAASSPRSNGRRSRRCFWKTSPIRG